MGGCGCRLGLATGAEPDTFTHPLVDANNTVMPLQPDLLEILRCPKCLGRVTEGAKGLQCDACRLVFPVVDDIPNFLLEEALPLD